MTSTQIIILGNIVSFIGAMVMISIGLIKSKKKVLLAQCAQFIIMGLGNLILGGITGFLSNIVSMVRNLWLFKFKYTWPVKLFFIAIQILLSYKINELGFIGWLPVISSCAFTWFLDVKSDLGLKIVIIVTLCPWLIYDIYLMNYSATAFDILSVITNSIGLLRILKDQKKQ